MDTADELDVIWSEISQVFKLTSMFGPPVPAGTEKASLLSNSTLAFLARDTEMAMFVEDFVLDAYRIQLREDVVPAFWRYFTNPLSPGVEPGPGCGPNLLPGFNHFCQAVTHLHANIQSLTVPGLAELARIRKHCGLTERTVWGSKDLSDIFKIKLLGSLHSQLPEDWQTLVSQFYNLSFTVFCGRESSGSVPNTPGGSVGEQVGDDSGDWSGSLRCPGCGEQTEPAMEATCLCNTIQAHFQECVTRLAALGILERISEGVVTEIVQSKIVSHVQETCQGSFDSSYLAPLESWLELVPIQWLKTHRPSMCSGKEREGLLEFLYLSYTRARIDQLFNIIIEFPESQPALEDLKECLGLQPQLRQQLTSSLRQVLDMKLLHPGVGTADIITAYIAAIRALRILDGSGVVLSLVCENVRKYLKTREDTVRSIVQALLDESTELAEEITKSSGLQLDQSFQDDASVLTSWEDWMPDPVDADPSKDQGRRSADIISMLVNIYGSKELFVNEYRSLLSNRLLSPLSTNMYDTDKEIRHLELLKLRFGEVSLHQCEVMLKDIGDSKRINSHLRSEDGGYSQILSQVFPVNSLILSAQFWPQFKAETLELPAEVCSALGVYTKAFQSLKGNRTLVWKHHLGFANLDLEIGSKKINLTVSPVHAAIIYKFQEAATWTTHQLAASLKVPVSTLRRKITFWVGQGLIAESQECPDTYSLIEPTSEGDEQDSSSRAIPGEMQGPSCVVGVEDECEDNVTASSSELRQEEMSMFWSYILGMLTNLESLPLERIHMMLKIFAMQGQVVCDINELRAFLDTKVREHQLTFSGGNYRLPK